MLQPQARARRCAARARVPPRRSARHLSGRGHAVRWRVGGTRHRPRERAQGAPSAVALTGREPWRGPYPARERALPVAADDELAVAAHDRHAARRGAPPRRRRQRRSCSAGAQAEQGERSQRAIGCARGAWRQPPRSGATARGPCWWCAQRGARRATRAAAQRQAAHALRPLHALVPHAQRPRRAAPASAAPAAPPSTAGARLTQRRPENAVKLLMAAALPPDTPTRHTPRRRRARRGGRAASAASSWRRSTGANGVRRERTSALRRAETNQRPLAQADPSRDDKASAATSAAPLAAAARRIARRTSHNRSARGQRPTAKLSASAARCLVATSRVPRRAMPASAPPAVTLRPASAAAPSTPPRSVGAASSRLSSRARAPKVRPCATNPGQLQQLTSVTVPRTERAPSERRPASARRSTARSTRRRCRLCGGAGLKRQATALSRACRTPT